MPNVHIEKVADPHIVTAVSRMMEKEYGLIHNKDYHMTFVYSGAKPANLRIKMLVNIHKESKDKLMTSIGKIYDHSMIL